MPNDTLVLGLIGGGLIAGSAYLYMSAKPQVATTEETEKDILQRGGPDVWLAGTNATLIPQNQSLLNALDSLAAYRHVDNIQFNKLINEIEDFYAFYLRVMSKHSGRENPTMVAWGAQYMINIKTHMLVLKRLVLEKYPVHQREMLTRRLDNRIAALEGICNGYNLNFIKEAKCKKVQ